jgi:hypothetical protein
MKVHWNHKNIKSVIYAAVVLISCPAFAQTGSMPQKGDVIHLDVDLSFKQKSTLSSETEKEVCIKSRTGFNVVSSDQLQIVLQRRDRNTILHEDHFLNKTCDEPSTDLGDPKKDHHVYVISPNELKRDYYRNFGLTHGALFVPFKRRSDNSLSGESNLGYYLGYRYPSRFGITVTPAVSAGLSIVNITDDSATTGSSTLKDSGNRAAFTYSAGFILTHLDAFQVGLFAGKDQIGGDIGKNWKYEGKWWTSIAFGYAFSR